MNIEYKKDLLNFMEEGVEYEYWVSGLQINYHEPFLNPKKYLEPTLIKIIKQNNDISVYELGKRGNWIKFKSVLFQKEDKRIRFKLFEKKEDCVQLFNERMTEILNEMNKVIESNIAMRDRYSFNLGKVINNI